MTIKMFLLLNIIFKVMIDKIFFSLSLPKFLQTVSISIKFQNRN